MPYEDPTTWLDVDLPNGTKVRLDHIFDNEVTAFSPNDVKQIVVYIAERERQDILDYLGSNESLEAFAKDGPSALVAWVRERGVKPQLRAVK